MANTNAKVNETMVLESIRAAVLGEELPYDNVFVEDIVEFVDKKIAQKADKAAKAKERNAEKKAKGDELQAVVAAALTEDFQTADEILAAIEVDEDVTVAKVRYRLTALVELGTAVKDKVNKKVAYKLA